MHTTTKIPHGVTQEGPVKANQTDVLITTNPMNHEGGVVAFYQLLFAEFDSPRYRLIHEPIGSRMEHFYWRRMKYLLYPLYYIWDFCRIALRLVQYPNIRIVQVNPSLIPVPLFRDGLVILMAKILGRKVIVFFRGWKLHFLHRLQHRSFARWLFRSVYGRCDVAIVLANRFREDLSDLIEPPGGIHVTTTMYRLEDVVPAVDRRGKIARFLFLGRIVEKKGVAELVDAIRLTHERGYSFEFVFVGHGARRGIVEAYEERVRECGLAHSVRFLGRLTGHEKFRQYAGADVYVLPSWSEGCPTTALEALGSGLFVISTDVGALAEIIDERQNGRIVRQRDANDLAGRMAWAIANIEELRSRREAIREDAESRFSTKVVTKQLEAVYDNLVADN